LVVDDRVEGGGAGGGDGEADAAHGVARREAAAEPSPGPPRVGGLPYSAPRPALEEVPRRARALPRRRIEDVGMGGIEDDVDRARPLVHEEDAAPALAA